MKQKLALFMTASLLLAPSAWATDYLSAYGNTGNYYYSPYGRYINKTSGSIGTIDRTGAHPQANLRARKTIVTYTNPCGNYNRRPEHCRNITMAYNPDASVSRTRGLRIPFMDNSRVLQVYRGSAFSNVKVQPK